jgi:serine/threonine protein kinase
VTGEPIDQLVRRAGRLDWVTASCLVAEVAATLAREHERGRPFGNAGPADFVLATDGAVRPRARFEPAPQFVSPEQAGGKSIGEVSEVYSLGATYYFLLTGTQPFHGKSEQEIFLKHFFYTPESPKIYDGSIPDDVCALVLRCLRKKRMERIAGLDVLAREAAALAAVVPSERLKGIAHPDGGDSSAGVTARLRPGDPPLAGPRPARSIGDSPERE